MALKDFFARSPAAGETSEARGQADRDLSSVRSEISASRRRLSKAERAAYTAELERELDKLYAPENWEALATFYPDVRFVTTGSECFIPSDKERAACAVSLATVARLLIKLDPGYVALIIFATSQAKMISRMEMSYKREQKAKVRRIDQART